jgi:hypothetical protein
MAAIIFMFYAFLHVIHQYAVSVVLLTVTAMCRHAMERAYHALHFIVPTPNHRSEFLKNITFKNTQK